MSKAQNNKISKELRSKANDFLNSRKCSQNLSDIIGHLKECAQQKRSITPALLTLETVFKELLKRRELSVDAHCPLKPVEIVPDTNAETKFREWLLSCYEQTLNIAIDCIESSEKWSEAAQALVTSMKLMAAEGKYPLDKTDEYFFPKERLRNIFEKLLSSSKSQSAVIERFKEYSSYLDVVYHSWKLLPSLLTKTAFANEKFALNFLELLNTLSVTKDLQQNKKLLCSFEKNCSEKFDYRITRRNINKLWNALLACTNDISESVHKQILVVLIERILPHLDKPILLTDFLMDSMDCGGAISLLALQGTFVLIQKHNITYPNIYEKLYSMFEPEIFYIKYKARLFYLADIFLSSTHLPESLVAAFAKRLARLSLLAPPQDIIIILYFIGNLMLRYEGLKRLICAETAEEVPSDPYIMDERDPMKSNALDSSLWEIALLQKHAIPDVATAARFISQPLPKTEWDLSSVLEMKEEDMFFKEISRKPNEFALADERPNSLFLPKNDLVSQYWKLF